MLRAIGGVFLVLWPLCLADEAIYAINGKKGAHRVSDKFLSLSIDPAVLLTGLNLSDTTLQLAKRLSPAYVRIAGPSTRFVRYQDSDSGETGDGDIVVTPTMWFGVNEWLAAANLTPVFGINDADTTREGWNPQDAMALLDISDKLNVSCYWQLGYDCSNKSESRYVSDLERLQHILDAFPDKKDQWRVVGSDASRCALDFRRTVEHLPQVLAAAVKEPTGKSESRFLEELEDLYTAPRVPIWVVSPKSGHPASFSSAVAWAKQMGEAARKGYEVILRQPRLHEIFSESPPFWVSVLHKSLMGRNVLEAKASVPHPEVSLYAHCARHQNDFIRSGAMTVLAVNNGTTNHTILVKFGTVLFKNAEVQSYILTSPSEDATDVYLNGERLSLDSFVGDRIKILPKLRRARIMNYLSLSLPPKSIGFFVLPGAQIPVCVSNEADLKQLMEEIQVDQNIPFSDDESSVELSPRFAAHKTPSLRELQEVMERELESDERYYQQMKTKKKKKKSHEDADPRALFIERAKHKQDNRRVQELKQKPHEEEKKRIFELELTSTEIRRVLSDRAKVKAAKKNIIFTSEELEEIMNRATDKFLNSEDTLIRIRKAKREVTRDKKDINMRLLKLKSFGDRRNLLKEMLNRRGKLHQQQKRERRDINMDLLKLKTEMKQSKTKKTKKSFENNEEKVATIREAGQTSEEMMGLLEEEDEEESPLPDEDVFAELADPDELLFTTTEKSRKGLKTKGLFGLHKPKIAVTPMKFEAKDAVQARDFEVDSVPDEDDGGNFDCIHEFFRKKSAAGGEEKQNASELWEVGVVIEDKRDDHLPLVTNRGFALQESDLDTKTNLGEYFRGDEEGVSLENDYDDLESDESGPLRLKRSIDGIGEGKWYYVFGKGYDPAKITIDETLKDQQIKVLKERLAYKKKLDFINRNNELLHKRKVRSPEEKTKRRYKSLTEGLRVWKPTDVLGMKKSDRGKLRSDKGKVKRSVDNYAGSVENEIGNFLSEMSKDAGGVVPQLDKENGDYELVFPNKDKIEVVENRGETELRLVLHEDSTEKNGGSGKGESTTASNIQKVWKKRSDNVWEKLYEKLSRFFRGLGTKLRKCIMEDLLK
ncbi:hypothetical protein MTP99_016467 [Tenebrio molitor]|nr:hypothetical protein MTP99_016467 [Tenebrio molitor]